MPPILSATFSVEPQDNAACRHYFLWHSKNMQCWELTTRKSKSISASAKNSAFVGKKLLRFLNLVQWKRCRELSRRWRNMVERNEKNQQAVLVCHALVMTLYNPFGNNFQNYLLLKAKNGFININCSLITRFAFLEGSACKGAVE